MTHADALFARTVAPFARENHSPSGIVAIGTAGSDPAVYSWGTEYTTTSPYRIASLTKSFTSLALLVLHREGALALDEPLATYVPEIRFAHPPEWPAVTIRHAVSMSAGFATDNPWGDRQESITRDELSEMMASGIRTIFPAGTGLEYSNFGYAILGEIITRVSGLEYRDFVTEHIITPAGLTRTAFTAEEVTSVVPGWHREPALPGEESAWTPQQPSGPGAFSSIGGLFSTVEDIYAWATMFVTREAPAAARFTTADLFTAQQIVKTGPLEHLPILERHATSGYAFGLRIQEVPGVGRLVGHAGGYPGFTCRMLWHEESNTIVVTSANGTHAGAPGLGDTVLHTHLAHRVTPQRQPDWPELANRADEITAFVRAAVAGETEPAGPFAGNVAQDVPIDLRVAFLRSAAVSIGALGDALPITAEAPCRARWDIPGTHGVLRVFIELEPLAPFNVQTFTVDLVNGTKRMRVF